MPTLTVWRFPSPYGADAAEYTLGELQRQELIKVHDAAVVRWETGDKKPRTRQANHLTGGGALGGSFWGLLFGLVFFVPILGMAVGAAVGAMSGSLSDAGINEDFINSVRGKVTPGTSALFILSSDAVMHKVTQAFAGRDMEMITTNLSVEQEMALREAFSD